MSQQEAIKFKDLGNKAFQSGQFEEAIELFTKAIQLNPNDHVFYSNRSGCYASLKKYDQALEDASKCVSIKPDWAKGYQRKGLAEFYLQKYEESEATYKEGLKLDPTNQLLQDGLKRVLDEKKGGGQNDFQNQMFTKLMQNPKTAEYLKDPAFIQKLQMMQSNPQMMTQFMNDPQMADAFQVMFGIDVNAMKQPQQPGQPQPSPGPMWEDISPKEEQPKTQQQQPQQPQQSKPQPKPQQQESEADQEKNLGNTAYKNRNFDQAIIHYDNAIKLNKEEVLYYNNKAAVFIEQKKYQEAFDVVNNALQVYQDGSKKDFVKLAKLLARKANIYKLLGDYKSSLEFYDKSLLEDQQYKVKEEMKAVQKLQKEKEALEYINPQLAEQHNDKARDVFKSGDYPGAIKEYDEAIRRNPSDPKLHNNKAACLLKLMDFPNALRCADKALELDPTFIKAYAKKGNAHFGMKEYHKALEVFQKGLAAEPNNQDFVNGISKTQSKIYGGQSESKEDQEERARHAMADPEIQAILQDPNIMTILRNLQEKPNDPHSLKALQDPAISAKINKLMQAGILRTG